MRSLSNSHGKDPAPKSPILWVNKSAGGMEFSTKEINLLISQYDHIMNISQDKAFDAWATWAATVCIIATLSQDMTKFKSVSKS